jgi:hypothetical protein
MNAFSLYIMQAKPLRIEIKKRKRAELTGYGPGEEIDNDVENEEIELLHHKIKYVRSTKGFSGEPFNKFKAANPVVFKKRDLKASGHIVKDSGDKYKSAKGKGDVLKSGTHEPHAYISLMLRC